MIVTKKIAFLTLLSLHILPYFLNIPSQAFIIIISVSVLYIGCIDISISENDKNSETESISRRDVIIFPFIGSAVLLILYICFKFLDKWWINFFLRSYIIIMGSFSIASVFCKWIYRIFPSFIKIVLFKSDSKIFLFLKYFKIFSRPSTDDNNSNEVNLKDEAFFVSFGDILSYSSAILLSILYLYNNHQILSNLLAICFSLKALDSIDISSFKNCAILLILLFFYDIFWVFGTDVMVTVAQSFDVPVKILFPIFNSDSAQIKYSMLGLGDIVVPGLLLSLMRRFDLYLKNNLYYDSFFITSLIGYFIGISTTLAFNFTFNAPQPALLYLVPSCLLAVTIKALKTKQFMKMLEFNTEYLTHQEPGEKNSINRLKSE